MSVKHSMGALATGLTALASKVTGRSFAATGIAPLSGSFYDLQVSALDGSVLDLSQFAGRVTLAVNVASQCGFTPQYAGLEQLHREFGPRGFTVIGFPSNEFGAQEPGSGDTIRSFCERKYGVSFPLAAKLRTQPGPGQSPVYSRLGESGQLPRWNFYKYLIGRDGQVVAVFPTSVAPDAPALREAVEKALQM